MENLKLLVTIGFCFLISFALNAQDIDPNYYYRLSNSFLKEGRSLDTYSDGKNDPFMGKTGSYSGQMWKFTPTGNGYYRLTNAFLGDERSLDTYSNGKNQPFMAKTGNYSGQMWKFTPIGNGYYRMTNSFLKEGRSLDTYSNGKNQPFMAKTGNYSGQMWKLTKLSKVKPVANEKPKLDDVKGSNVNLVVFNNGKTTATFKQTALNKWQEYDAAGRAKFQFEETARDEWSVYMIDKSRGGMKIQLDLHTKNVLIDGKVYYKITDASVVTNGLNVKTVNYDNAGKKGSFSQNGNKWGEFDAAGKKKWTFDETARDEWSVYLIDKTRNGMKIQLDLHTKNVSIDGTAYYKITSSAK